MEIRILFWCQSLVQTQKIRSTGPKDVKVWRLVWSTVIRLDLEFHQLCNTRVSSVTFFGWLFVLICQSFDPNHGSHGHYKFTAQSWNWSTIPFPWLGKSNLATYRSDIWSSRRLCSFSLSLRLSHNMVSVLYKCRRMVCPQNHIWIRRRTHRVTPRDISAGSLLCTRERHIHGNIRLLVIRM